MNILDKKGLDIENIFKQVNLVWASTEFGAAADKTPEYFKIFKVKPADEGELFEVRNQRLLKHVMLGKLLWNSLTPEFQLELLAEEDDFKRDEENDGLLLWKKILQKVNP